MIEVPSAALLAHHLANHADFLSIGTNDLTQYTLAADRTNPRLARYSDAAHPAVLRLCHETAGAASASGISVSVCGEAAADPVLAVLFAALGISKLSVSPPSVNLVKAAVAETDPVAAADIAAQALAAPDAETVREIAGPLVERVSG
jgi:phosphocarrier protein FPr